MDLMPHERMELTGQGKGAIVDLIRFAYSPAAGQERQLQKKTMEARDKV